MANPSLDREALILEIARMINRQGISINKLCEVLGVDLDANRVDADDVISQLSGIFIGWKNPADE